MCCYWREKRGIFLSAASVVFFISLNCALTIPFFTTNTMSHPFMASCGIFCTSARNFLFALFRSVAFFDTFLLTTNPYRLYMRLFWMHFNKKNGVATNIPFPNTFLKSFSLTNLCVRVSTVARLYYRELYSPFPASFCNSPRAGFCSHPHQKPMLSRSLLVFWFICFSHILYVFYIFSITI